MEALDWELRSEGGERAELQYRFTSSGNGALRVGDIKRNLPASRADGNRLTENWTNRRCHYKELNENFRVDVLERHTEQTKPMSTMFL